LKVKKSKEKFGASFGHFDKEKDVKIVEIVKKHKNSLSEFFSLAHSKRELSP